MSKSPALRSYVTGFGLSLILTLAAYFLVVNHALPKPVLVLTIAWMAIAQFVVQALYFLHIGKESGPRWNFLIFISMISTVFILVFGSLWIMTNLNYRTGRDMSPQQTNTTILKDENIKR